jgi:hypothetical protein
MSTQSTGTTLQRLAYKAVSLNKFMVGLVAGILAGVNGLKTGCGSF